MSRKHLSNKTVDERLGDKIIHASNLLEGKKLFHFVDFIEKKLKEMKRITEKDFGDML
jgi:hypothetical protein